MRLRKTGRRSWRGLILGGVALLVAAIAPVAFAAWTTINTDDGQVDPSWGSPDYTDACTFTSRQVDEIKSAWIRWDGTALYFRMDTCATPPLTTAGPGHKMRAIAAIDCNKNGSFQDPDSGGTYGDRLVAYYDDADAVWLLTGSGTAVYQLPNATYAEEVPTASPTSIEWRMPIQYIYPACRGSIDALQVVLATVEVQGFNSTTIDQSSPVTWHNPMDYGDLPNPNPQANPPTCEQYPTRVGCDGPRHGIVSGAAILGPTVDADGGELQSATAGLDDQTNTGSADDEDGVTPTRAFVWSNGGSGSLDVTISGGSGYLNCWVDWNDDDDFADSGEQIVTNAAVSPGTSARTFAVPVDPLNLYYARCRVSPNAGATLTGAIYGGEVEDYRWLPLTTALAIAKPNASDVQLTWSDLSASDGYNIYRSASPYFGPGDGGVSLLTGSPFADPPATDAGVLGNAADDNYFYVLTKTRTVSSVTYESVPSNTVGLFEFALVAGTP